MGKRAEPARESPTAFGKRVGASRQVISRAIQSGRLNASVRREDGRWLIDVESGLQEWKRNRSRLPRTPPRPPARRPSLFVSPDRFSVAMIADAIVLAIWLGAKDGEPTLLPLTSATAAELGARLLERAGVGTTDDDGSENDDARGSGRGEQEA